MPVVALLSFIERAGRCGQLAGPDASADPVDERRLHQAEHPPFGHELAGDRISAEAELDHDVDERVGWSRCERGGRPSP